jgi:hypothetical protein
MRALVYSADGRISKELLLRIADDYEAFADSIEQRPNRFLPPEEVVPAEVRQYGTRGHPSDTAPSLVPEDIPDFLKRPSMAREPSDDNER